VAHVTAEAKLGARVLDTPPPVFCKKSAEAVENKGSRREKERKEKSRARKQKEAKEIEEVKEAEGEHPARFVRVNTRNGNTDLDGCQ
jgi:hypothetical protein